MAHLREIYGVEASPDLVSRVTDAVVEELAEWQSRPLDAISPVVFIDALMVKIRDGVVANQPVVRNLEEFRRPTSRGGSRHDRHDQPTITKNQG